MSKKTYIPIVHLSFFMSCAYSVTLYSDTDNITTINEPFPRNLSYKEGTIKPDFPDLARNLSIKALPEFP